MNIYKVPATVLLALTLAACGGGETAQDTDDNTGGDSGQEDVVQLIPGIGVNGNLQAVPSKSEE